MKINYHSVINQETEGTKLFEVGIFTTFKILNNGNLPSSDKEYTLNTENMQVVHGGNIDCVLVKVNGELYVIHTHDYDYYLRKGDNTASLSMTLTFRVFAENEEHAYNTVVELINAKDNGILDFLIHDQEQDEKFNINILSYKLSHLYEAKEALYQKLDTDPETLAKMNIKQLYNLFMEVNDLLAQNAYEEEEFIENIAQMEFDIVWQIGKLLGFNK